MIRLLSLISYSLVFVCCTAAAVQAQQHVERRAVVRVQPDVTVSNDRVTLGDIARIQSAPNHAAFGEKLATLEIGDAPMPKQEHVFRGESILERFQEADIKLEHIGYVIPESVIVRRSGRVLKHDEALAAVRAKLESERTFDLKVRDVIWGRPQVVSEGGVRFSVERLGAPAGGRVPIRIVAHATGGDIHRFLATAIVDDWRDVPVLTRGVGRGRLIDPAIVRLVRLNVTEQPADAVVQLDQLVGRRATRSLNAGVVIREQQIDVPPLVERGAPVTMRFRRGALEATATGSAMDAGHEGDVITVRNERSRRVIKAKILNAELVEVLP